MRVCKTCNEPFIPSSGHLSCPKCRELAKKKKCLDCDNLVFHKQKRCTNCQAKNRTGTRSRDRLTGFKEFINRAKRRGKLGDLTVEDVYEVWIKQEGVCVYSGVKLVLPSYKGRNDPIYTASLDRVDSSLLYEKGNIQFVSFAINQMKGEMTHEQTLELCRLIAQNARMT